MADESIDVVGKVLLDDGGAVVADLLMTSELLDLVISVIDEG